MAALCQGVHDEHLVGRRVFGQQHAQRGGARRACLSKVRPRDRRADAGCAVGRVVDLAARRSAAAR